MELLAKRKALRLLSNGVYVITSRDGDHYGGATITWLSQASFKPPRLMAAIRVNSNVFRCMSRSGFVVIHVLSAGQTDLAQRFFAPTRAIEGRLNGEPFVESPTGTPILETTPAHVECRVERILEDVGDHAIAILEVVEAEYRFSAPPLTVAASPWQYGG